MSLFAYQNYGARWLAGRKRALLGDGMRVGKTPQAIVACDMIGAESILVVCPGIARENWGREFDTFSLMGRPLAVVLDKDDPIEPRGVTIMSMDGSRNEGLHARVMRHTWDVIIIDEAQYLKEPTSQRTQQVVSANGFASRASRIWFLTGTPMLNHPGEMWVILTTIGVWKDSYQAFMNRFCNWFMGDYGPVMKGMKNVAELREMLARVMLRRTYYEMFPDAPKPTWIDVPLDQTHTAPADRQALLDLEDDPRFGAKARRAIERVMAGEEIDWSEEIEKANFALLRRATSIAKIKPTARWLREQLGSGEIDKIVVFAHHSRILDVLGEDLAGFGAEVIRGTTKADRRQRNIDEFNVLPGKRVLLCQDNIARTAIDLTGADKLMFAEMDPVPENNAQGAMRVQGPKQTKPVTLYASHLMHSTDELITKITARKSKMAAELFA